MQQLLGLLFGVVLGRLLDPADYGMIGMLAIFPAIASALQESGFVAALANREKVSDKDYLKTSVWKIWLNRVPWLLILMISATFTGLIINANEETLNMPIIGIILTGCIPMLMDTGGNAGSQASVTVIRGIALGEVQFKDTLKVIWKELRVSLLLGITLSVVCFGKLMLIDKLYAVENGYLIAAVVCVTMLVTVVIAKIIGCTLPLIAKKCRLDPAVVASPFITTIVDAVSLMIYCGIAVAVLGKIYTGI